MRKFLMFAAMATATALPAATAEAYEELREVGSHQAERIRTHHFEAGQAGGEP